MRIGGLIGVVHLDAMPGDPGAADGTGFEAVRDRALLDADALADGGVDAILVENFGSAPFPKGTGDQRSEPHVIAKMALVADEVKRRFGLPVGVNCLRNDAIGAIGIAAAAGADFVRVNVHTGVYATDQGLIEGEADRSLRYRTRIGAQSVRVFADVFVKHARPLSFATPEEAVRDTLGRGLADGVIVTGAATGEAVERERIERVIAVAGEAPVWIGSGLTPELAEDLVPLVHGAIVATWFQPGGSGTAVDRERVAALVAVTKGRFR